METPLSSNRLLVIDAMRGLVMIIMALDHVRDFFGPELFRPEDIEHGNGLLFFTRWITHLCAPTFVFLSGVSIALYENKVAHKSLVRRYLVTRGLWLMFAEFAIFSLLLTQGYQFFILEVIWIFGVSMLAMSGLIFFGRRVVLIAGVLVTLLHNLIPPFEIKTTVDGLLGVFYHAPYFISRPPVLVAYTVIPWLAIMMMGYGLAGLFAPELKVKTILRIGTGSLVLFLLLRVTGVYGDLVQWQQSPDATKTVMSFLNVSKYPPSLQFTLLTLGITFMLIPLLMRLPSLVIDAIAVYGKVPFFYFFLHLLIISLSSVVWTWISFGQPVNLSMLRPEQWPASYSPSLLRVYLIWIVLVALLYFPCRWFAGFKRLSSAPWLKYV